MTAVNFTRKKVGSLTLGEKLQKIRNDHRISLAEASKSTKIQVKYLEALESGSYEKLPPEVYVRGFLRGYASFLGVPEEAIIRMYDRERSIQKNLGRGEPFRFQPRSPIRFRFDISPKTMVAVSVAIVSLGFFSYLYFEFRSFVSDPRLVILEPVDGSSVSVTELLVSGETDRRAQIRINGEETIVGEDGRFSEQVTLTPGLNTISVSSVNRFGKERTKIVSVDADIPETPAMPILPENPSLPKKIQISVRVAETVAVTAKADGATIFSGRLERNEMRIFDVQEEIVVSSANGPAVFVRIGSGPEESLSSDPGPAERTFRSAADIPAAAVIDDVDNAP
jgi:cytoskeletal protein RodZ